MPRYPGPDTFPGLLTLPGAVFAFVFEPPTTERASRLEGSLFCTTSWGKSVWRIDGVWFDGFLPTADVRDAADRFYAGGSIHTLSPAEVSELTAAGYGAYITSKEIL